MIRIITDTTASLTQEEYQKYNLISVPLYVRHGEIAQKELYEISYEEFYQKQRSGVKFTTSQPDPHSFLEAFRPIIEAGDEIICISISSGISGTINSAHLAAEMLATDRISLVDSRQSGAGLAAMVLEAQSMANNGKTRTQILAHLEDLRNRTKIFFLLESLRYLYEGGRLTGAQALIGSIIQIKPIIWFNPSGKMTTLEKVRSLKAAKARIMELITEEAKLGIMQAALHYGDNLTEATQLAEEIKELIKLPVPLVKLSPVLGAHTGPDMLAPMIITQKTITQ